MTLFTRIKAANEAFEVERIKVADTDSLAQIFDVSSDLVNSRLLISQVPDSLITITPFGKTYILV